MRQVQRTKRTYHPFMEAHVEVLGTATGKALQLAL
jgi:hypothetical protein